MLRRMIEIGLLVLLATLLAHCGTPAGPTSNTGAARRGGVVEACTLLTPSDLDAAFGRQADAGKVGAEPFICTWQTKDNPLGTAPKLLMLTVFTGERIKAGGGGENAAAYYTYTSRAAGTVYKTEPEQVAGVGEQAMWGSNADQAKPQGQLFVLHQEAVFQFVAAGLDKAAVETVAKQALANY